MLLSLVQSTHYLVFVCTVCRTHPERKRQGHTHTEIVHTRTRTRTIHMHIHMYLATASVLSCENGEYSIQ